MLWSVDEIHSYTWTIDHWYTYINQVAQISIGLGCQQVYESRCVKNATMQAYKHRTTIASTWLGDNQGRQSKDELKYSILLQFVTLLKYTLFYFYSPFNSNPFHIFYSFFNSFHTILYFSLVSTDGCFIHLQCIRFPMSLHRLSFKLVHYHLHQMSFLNVTLQ